MKKTILLLISALFLLVFPFQFGAPLYAAGSDVQNVGSPQDNQIVVEIDGTVSKQIAQDKWYFISGDFSKAKVENGIQQDRQNMIVLDLDKKDLSDWKIDTDAPVLDMTIVNNKLFISGSFMSVNGIKRSHVAGFDIASNQLIMSPSGANSTVNSIAEYGNTVFFTGAFTSFENRPRLRIASWDSVNNKLNTWNPRVNNTIYDSLIYNDRLYIVGEFTDVNGFIRKYAASFTLPDGQLTSWAPNPDFPVRNISVDGENIILQAYNGATVQSQIDTSVPVFDTNKAVSQTTNETASVEGLMIDREKLGFTPPTLSDVLTFVVRVFFVIGGLAALFYLLRGALSWITSGGDKDSVAEARNQIQAAIIGLIMIVAVLAVVWTLEQVIFKRAICIGLSCPLTIPSLIEPI